MEKEQVLLIGAGSMAVEYAKVLSELNITPIVICRSEKSAESFLQKTAIEAKSGGLKKYFQDKLSYPRRAIVCVSEKQLGIVTLFLLQHNIENILVEKPGGFNEEEIQNIDNISKEKKINVFVGYNRRFYSSVLKAKELIKEDGGVTSFFFEFTEWGHVIEKLIKEDGVKENWFLHNSTHVIDLAFYLGGKPKESCSYISGSLKWHPSASIFTGAGISETGALFSYQANWEAPGRWGVEVLTNNYRLIFRPMEKLQIQKKGNILIEEELIDDILDKEYKPGLYRQTKAFLDNPDSLLNIKEQVAMLHIYDRILNGQ